MRDTFGVPISDETRGFGDFGRGFLETLKLWFSVIHVIAVY